MLSWNYIESVAYSPHSSPTLHTPSMAIRKHLCYRGGRSYQWWEVRHEQEQDHGSVEGKGSSEMEWIITGEITWRDTQVVAEEFRELLHCTSTSLLVEQGDSITNLFINTIKIQFIRKWKKYYFDSASAWWFINRLRWRLESLSPCNVLLYPLS